MMRTRTAIFSALVFATFRLACHSFTVDVMQLSYVMSCLLQPLLTLLYSLFGPSAVFVRFA